MTSTASVKSLPAKAAFPGTVKMFLAAGFQEIVVTQAKSKSGGFLRSIVRCAAKNSQRSIL